MTNQLISNDNSALCNNSIGNTTKSRVVNMVDVYNIRAEVNLIWNPSEQKWRSIYGDDGEHTSFYNRQEAIYELSAAQKSLDSHPQSANKTAYIDSFEIYGE